MRYASRWKVQSSLQGGVYYITAPSVTAAEPQYIGICTSHIPMLEIESIADTTRLLLTADDANHRWRWGFGDLYVYHSSVVTRGGMIQEGMGQDTSTSLGHDVDGGNVKYLIIINGFQGKGGSFAGQKKAERMVVR